MKLHRKSGLALLFVVFALVGSACDDGLEIFDRVEGSGNLVTETADVSGFDEIVVLGSGEVTVEMTGQESLEVTVDDNILPFLEIEVSGSRLELGFKSGTNIDPSAPVTYRITADDLVGVTITGSGDVLAGGLDNRRFDVDITGSGDVELHGKTSLVDVTIAGSGEFDGTGLESFRGEVTISGSGSAVMNVIDELDVTISGSGDVTYTGDPVVDQTISGSGDVSQR
jgi:hypothetical protein